MKSNSDTPQKLYIGLDVHKEQTVIAIVESDRDAEARQHGSIATTQQALERAMRRIAKQQELGLADLHVCNEASGWPGASCKWVCGGTSSPQAAPPPDRIPPASALLPRESELRGTMEALLPAPD